MKFNGERVFGFFPAGRNLPGQTLVIVLLVMVASLTVGLAVSTRTISTLRQTTFTSQASGALSAAEAGAEVALKRLADTADSCSSNVLSGALSCTFDAASKTYTGGPCYGSQAFSAPSESGASFSYCVGKGGGGTNDYIFDLQKDKTQEIKINKGGTDSYGANAVTVCWYIQNFDHSPAASLEMMTIGTGGLLGKFAYNSNTDSNGTSGNGFSPASTGDATYKNCQSVDVTSAKVLRLRAVYNDVSVAVRPAVGSPLPFQSYQIESVGALGGVIKRVRVTKSLPALPALFDFGLFSGSQSQPITNQ